MKNSVSLFLIISIILVSGFLILYIRNKTVTVSNAEITSPTITPSVLSSSDLKISPTVVVRTSLCISNGIFPDKNCTPGAIDLKVTQDNIYSTICVIGYTTKVRPPPSVTSKIKTERMRSYGYFDSAKNYELDHLISLEVGGCPDCLTNLWPEPYNNALGAYQKDKVENYLHEQICKGNMTLKEAQQKEASDWVEIYNSLN